MGSPVVVFATLSSQQCTSILRVLNLLTKSAHSVVFCKVRIDLTPRIDWDEYHGTLNIIIILITYSFAAEVAAGAAAAKRVDDTISVSLLPCTTKYNGVDSFCRSKSTCARQLYAAA